MAELFLELVSRSIAASWLVGAVLLLRLLLKKYPKWVNMLLWAMVAVRLVCPVTMESTLSLVPKALGNGELVSEWADDYVGDISMIHDTSIYYDAAVTAGREPIAAEGGGYYVVTQKDQLGAPATVENTLVPVLAMVWIAGTLGMALYTAISYWLLRKKLATATVLRYNIYQSEYVNTPFVLGIWKPRVYLPYRLSRETIIYVIAHEKAHIRRRDHWWKPLGFLLVTVYWFNPVLWLGYRAFCRDIELACDEAVIRNMNHQQRADYAGALLACSVKPHTLAACPLAFGEVGVKARIKSVMHYRKPAFWVLLVAMVLCLAVAVCFLTNPEETEIRNTVQGNMRTYYEMTDGTWVCEGVSYEQRLERKGRLPNAAVDTVYVYLSNVDISFEQAYQATVSSHTEDFFKAEDAVLVEMWNEEPQTIPAEETEPVESAHAAPEHQEVADLAWFMELSAFEKEFVEMSPERKAQIIPEYGGLLDGYDLIARESTDGTLAYIVGCWPGAVEESPLYYLHSVSRGDENGEMELLYDERDLEAAEKYEEPEYKYVIHNSHLNHSSSTGCFLIHPTDSGWGFNDVFNSYLRPKGREYLLDAFSRGIALSTPEGPYLEVYLISETWGEITERIPLTEEQAAQILSEPREKLDAGHGFAAGLFLGSNSAVNTQEDALYFTEARGVPQTALDLAVEKCGYKFASPGDIQSDIVEAKLECSWLEQPIYAQEADLQTIQSILKGAEFGYVGGCGYGAKLTIQMEDGTEMTMFKGTDGCDSAVFGSYGGYFLGDDQTKTFWDIFGIDIGQAWG